MNLLNFLQDKLLEKDDIKKWVAMAVTMLACAVRLALSATQYATIYPPLAPIDDDLMFRAAQSIVAGEWLGAYNYLTISKHAFFALWLAFLHVLHVPFLVGNMALWIGASVACTQAFKPALKCRWARLLMFLGLIYNPAACRQYATRVYRDAIFPSLCLMFFSGLIAIGLRYKQDIKHWLGWGALYGLSFGCIYLCREDGVWVAPFAVVALAVVLVLNMVEKRGDIVKKCVATMAPFALSALIISGYCYQNYRYYGRFIVSDFTSKEFKSAYGALTSLEQDNWHPMVAVPEDVREDVYREVPMFAPVKEALTEPLLENGYKNAAIGDFASGAFYWGLRTALQNMGIYDSPQKAEQYFISLTDGIQQAVDEGRLATSNGKSKLRSSVTPPIKMEYVPGVWGETWRGLVVAITFQQCDPLAGRAVGRVDEIEPVEQFIYQKGATALLPYTEIPYLSPVRSVTHKIMRVAQGIYAWFIPLLVLIALTWQIKQLAADITAHRFTTDSMLNIVLLGLIGMALLRCAMIAFVEVSSFGIGTYVMYLSTVHPLLIAYGFVGFCKTMEE